MSHRLSRLTPLAALLLLGACATTPPAPRAETTPATALDAWPARVQVTPQADEVRLAAHATGLSANQARALSEFQLRWMQAEGGVITVSAPTNGGDATGSYRVSQDARAFLLARGAPAEMVRLVGYDAAGQAEAPVVVGFQRYVATAPECGEWRDLTKTFGNTTYGNFGCAVSANIAAQVANPEDLLHPRGMTPADPQRRSTVFDKYRNGTTTSTARDQQASGAISTAVQ